MKKIGSYIPPRDGHPAIIQREWLRQGFVFKDESAFTNDPDRVCYIPELSDNVYTRRDFVNLCGGQEDFAQTLFHAVDWQHPETLLEDNLHDGIWGRCSNCGMLYDDPDSESSICPSCRPILNLSKAIVSEWNISVLSVADC